MDILNLSDPRQIEALRFSPYIEDNELNQVAFALAAQRYHLSPYTPSLNPLVSGAVPLFPKGFSPWGALPYPNEHAQLGSLLMQLEDGAMRTIAKRMLPFQEATLDHNKNPFFSLLRQESKGFCPQLAKINNEFFESVGADLAAIYDFTDKDLAMVTKRRETASLFCIGTGCKSGLGAFLSGDAGIVNYGPQQPPIGDCASFGLAGKAQNICLKEDLQEFLLSFRCRLAAPSSRTIEFLNFQDSGYSGLWMDAKISGNLEKMDIYSHFEGTGSMSKILFCFFGKGESCVIAGCHKLKPKSLDRYQGPAQSVHFFGHEGSVLLEAIEGLSGMQLIPLAGDTSYWGADFLACYSLSKPSVAFRCSAQ